MAALVMIQAVFALSEIARAIDRPYTWADQRQAMIDQLKHSGSKHLILVRYHADHNVHHEWVYNEADLENAPVVWAHSWRSELDEQLLSHYKGRQIWLLELNQFDEPKMSCWPKEMAQVSSRCETTRIPCEHTIH
jgi:hypothetical protein